jgi:hypothetical protein
MLGMLGERERMSLDNEVSNLVSKYRSLWQSNAQAELVSKCEFAEEVTAIETKYGRKTIEKCATSMEMSQTELRTLMRIVNSFGVKKVREYTKPATSPGEKPLKRHHLNMLSEVKDEGRRNELAAEARGNKMSGSKLRAKLLKEKLISPPLPREPDAAASFTKLSNDYELMAKDIGTLLQDKLNHGTVKPTVEYARNLAKRLLDECNKWDRAIRDAKGSPPCKPQGATVPTLEEFEGGPDESLRACLRQPRIQARGAPDDGGAAMVDSAG